MELPLQNKHCLSQVNMLRLEAAKSGLLPTSRPVRGRGGYRARGIRGAVSTYVPRGSWRGRGRGGRGFTLSPGSSTLDRRPSRYVGHSWESEINVIGKILLTWIVIALCSDTYCLRNVIICIFFKALIMT